MTMYSRTQWLVFLALFAAYTLCYVAKKNDALWLGPLAERAAIAPADRGLFASSFELLSGGVKLAGGAFVDSHDPVAVLAGAVAVAGAANLALVAAAAVAAPTLALAGTWGVNGAAQGLVWPALVRVFFAWFPDPRSRGAAYAALSVSQNVGAALAPLALAPLVARGGWAAALVAPGLVALVFAAALARLLPPGPPAPASAPAPAPAAAPAPAPALSSSVSSSASSVAPAPPGMLAAVAAVARDRVQWALALAYLGVSLARTGVPLWTPALAPRAVAALAGGGADAGVGVGVVVAALVAFEMGGLGGGLACGAVSDRFFGGRRAAPMAMASVAAAPLLLALSGWVSDGVAVAAPMPASTATSVVVSVWAALGALLQVPHVLLGLASRETADPRVGSTAGGLVKAVGQLGGAAAGWPLSRLAADAGWGTVVTVMAVAAGLAAVALVPLLGRGREEAARRRWSDRPKTA
jgi:sugar phosphate permease